jgi:hypothetical protein
MIDRPAHGRSDNGALAVQCDDVLNLTRAMAAHLT